MKNIQTTSVHIRSEKPFRRVERGRIGQMGQNIIFKELSRDGKQFVYDLSAIFTRSDGLNPAEIGYNKDKTYIPQINLALLYSVDSGLPTMVRALHNSAREVGIEGKILIRSCAILIEGWLGLCYGCGMVGVLSFFFPLFKFQHL